LYLCLACLCLALGCGVFVLIRGIRLLTVRYTRVRGCISKLQSTRTTHKARTGHCRLPPSLLLVACPFWLLPFGLVLGGSLCCRQPWALQRPVGNSGAWWLDLQCSYMMEQTSHVNRPSSLQPEQGPGTEPVSDQGIGLRVCESRTLHKDRAIAACASLLGWMPSA